jgi:hypothetical protein
MNLDKTLSTRTGQTLQRQVDETTSADATVRDFLLLAIDANLEGDDKMDTATKLKLARLGMKVEDKEFKSLSASEVTIALERASKAFNVLVYGQIVKELDPEQL